MLCSVVINNYNYAQYLKEAIESVLNQSFPSLQIIIIDDGSTDNSKIIIDNYARSRKNITAIYKNNAGQLSTFNEAKKHITGDIIFFLDADDIYKKKYIEEVVNIYNNNKDVDFVFCAFERFYIDGKIDVVQKYKSDYTLGFSILSTVFSQEWLGGETSTISMKREIFDSFMPIPYEQEWITRADDCLIWGASILGANKYFYHIPSVLYRAHENNHYFGKQFSRNYEYKRMLAINKLFSFLININGGKSTLYRLLDEEYKTRSPKNIYSFTLYFKLIRALDKKFLYTVKHTATLIKLHFLN